nr:hypothetical protein Q903MT_gene2676 [Picea sitchensis]
MFLSKGKTKERRNRNECRDVKLNSFSASCSVIYRHSIDMHWADARAHKIKVWLNSESQILRLSQRGIE